MVGVLWEVTQVGSEKNPMVVDGEERVTTVAAATVAAAPADVWDCTVMAGEQPPAASVWGPVTKASRVAIEATVTGAGVESRSTLVALRVPGPAVLGRK